MAIEVTVCCSLSVEHTQAGQRDGVDVGVRPDTSATAYSPWPAGQILHPCEPSSTTTYRPKPTAQCSSAGSNVPDVEFSYLAGLVLGIEWRRRFPRAAPPRSCTKPAEGTVCHHRTDDQQAQQYHDAGDHDDHRGGTVGRRLIGLPMLCVDQGGRGARHQHPPRQPATAHRAASPPYAVRHSRRGLMPEMSTTISQAWCGLNAS